MFAGGAHDEIGAGEMSGEEVRLEEFFVDSLCRHSAGDETLDRSEEFLPPAVIECQGQDQSIVVPRALDGAQHRGPELGLKAVQAANVAELRALAIKFVSLSINNLGQDAQDAVDLVLWAAPIVGRECPE